MLCFPPDSLARQSNGFFFVGTGARDFWWQPKKTFFVAVAVVGRKISVLYPEAENFYVFYDWTAL